MNQLDEHVKAWCTSVLPDDCGHDDRVEELEDHLLSEIARLEAEGLSQHQAFTRATRTLGEANMLISEFSKNRTFLSRLCALDRRLTGIDTRTRPALRKQAGRLLIGHAILWAAAILATSLMVEDGDVMGTLIAVVYIPLWFASFMLITGAFRSMQRE